MPAAWVSAAAAVYGATQSGGGGGSGGSGGSAYVPPNQAGMAQNFQTDYGAYQGQVDGFGAQITPYAAGTFQNLYNNPYSSQFQTAANEGELSYLNGAKNSKNASKTSFTAGNQIYQNAFDPQSTLYKQNLQQLTDSTRAAEYSRGIQTSPYGAAIEGNVLGNFQNDWNNQQLQREVSGIGAMNSANNAGQNLGSASGQMYVLGGQAPYSANNAIYNDQNSAIGGYYGAISPYLSGLQQLQSNALSYNNYGQGAQSQAFNQGQVNLQNQLNGIQGWSNAASDFGKAYKNWNTPTPTPEGNSSPSTFDQYTSDSSWD